MIQAVIFDVDGVLLDTVPYHFRAWQKMFEEEGLSFSFEDYVKRVNGLPRATGIKNILGKRTEEELEKLAVKKQRYFLEFVMKNSPKPLEGVINLLQKLQQQNLRLAAASSSKNAPLLLYKAGLTKFLHVTLGGNDFTHPKPHPDIFLTAAKKLRVDPNKSVVVEDASLGVQAAKIGGMKTIGLLSSNDLEIPKLADITIPSMNEHEKFLSFLKAL